VEPECARRGKMYTSSKHYATRRYSNEVAFQEVPRFLRHQPPPCAVFLLCGFVRPPRRANLSR
jgi:hypothetical protein